MSRVHDVLRWANRRDVAREVTKRGYRVSGETLNRWVRDEAEFPAIVERIVFELFTITGHEEAAPPYWAERLLAGVMALESKGGVTDAEVADAQARATAWVALEEAQRQQQRSSGGGSSGATS